MHKRSGVFALLLAVIVLFVDGWSNLSRAGPLVFGPQTFTREAGLPRRPQTPFEIASPQGTFWLQMGHGPGKDDKFSVSISTALINKQAGISQEMSDLKNRSRSRIQISKDDDDIVEIVLVAEDERIEILNASYCGGEKGAKQYRGRYYLIGVKNNTIASKIDLGKDHEFVEGTPHDGLHPFGPVGNEQLVEILQYGSCNNEFVEFYRVDPSGGIHKVNFFSKDGTVTTVESTGPDGAILSSEGSVTFCSYDNALGYLFCDSYAHNGADFIQKASWMTQDLSKKKDTIIAEARRALLEYLSGLWQGNYQRAVYYYGGAYDLLRELNPDVDPHDKPKLFERFCTVNGGRCLRADYFSDKDFASPTDLKFSVEFITKINGRSDFEFRVKRMNNEFKVLDLPPHTS